MAYEGVLQARRFQTIVARIEAMIRAGKNFVDQVDR
jgi:hypothetical protein